MVFGCISMLSGLALIVLYLCWKKLRRNPGMLIFWHILSQTMLDFYFFCSGVYAISTGYFPDSFCNKIGVLTIYFYFLGFNYALCLCIEVALKIKSPMDMRYRKRAKVYHITSHSLAFLICLLISASNQAGSASNHFCLIKRSSSYTYILTFPLISFLPALLITLYITCKMKSSKSMINYFLIKHSIYVTIYFLIWSPVILNIILNHNGESDDDNFFSKLNAVLSSSAGTIMSVIRISSHYLIRFVRKRNKQRPGHRISVTTLINDAMKCRKSMGMIPDYSDPFGSDYTNMFSSMSTESAFTAILVLNISLCNEPEMPTFKPPWPVGYYSNYSTKEITSFELAQVSLMAYMKTYCKLLFR